MRNGRHYCAARVFMKCSRKRQEMSLPAICHLHAYYSDKTLSLSVISRIMHSAFNCYDHDFFSRCGKKEMKVIIRS